MQSILKDQATAALRRVYFDAVSPTNTTVPLSATEMDIGGAGAFTVKLSKNGAAAATPTGSTITEVDAGDIKGLFYVELDAADVDTGGIVALNFSSAGGPSTMVPRRVVVRIPLINDQVAHATAADLATVATYVDTEIANIQTRLPAALVGGRIDASVGAMAAGTVTAAAIATDAIDADALAADALAEITAAIVAKVVYGTRTIKGVLTRLDRFMVGKATGLKAATAAFFAEDGVTKVIEAAQDTAAGTRDAATTIGGD